MTFIMAARKAGKFVKGMKKMSEKTIASAFLKSYIPAGRAMPAPPLGPQLGQVITFVVQLNRTSYKCLLLSPSCHSTACDSASSTTLSLTRKQHLFHAISMAFTSFTFTGTATGFLSGGSKRWTFLRNDGLS